MGEEDYARLRCDQGIRVDFANFPGQLIGLLDKCIACRVEDLPRQAPAAPWPPPHSRRCLRATASSTCDDMRPLSPPRQQCLCPPTTDPRFQAILQAGPAPAQGSLQVVENNEFKRLPHITLALRPACDAAVKQWLAFRLEELRGDAAQLSAELERTQAGFQGGGGSVRGGVGGGRQLVELQLEVAVFCCACCGPGGPRCSSQSGHAMCAPPQGERNSLQGSLAEVRAALTAAREQHERFALEHAADAKAREAALLETKSRELAEVREAAARCEGQIGTALWYLLPAACLLLASCSPEQPGIPGLEHAANPGRPADC